MNVKSNLRLTLLASSIIMLSTAYAGRKATAPDLFEFSNLPPIAGDAIAKKTVKGRKHRVMVHNDLLDLDRLTLNLFDDVRVTAVLDRMVKRRATRTWIGHVEGEQDSEVFLTIRGRTMSGTVQIGEKTYEIEPKSNSQYDILQVNPDRNPKHSVSKQPEDFIVTGGHADNTLPTAEGAQTMGAATAGTIIDVLVMYTSKAKNNSSGQAGIEAKITNAVAMANQAYLNSQIDMQLNLVGMVETSYVETGNMSQTLTDLTGTKDGKMDEVHTLRNQYGADQVALISADSNYCGIAYMMNSSWISAAFAPYAFSVVHDDSIYACLSNQTLAHELGHNQGNNHNIEDSGGSIGAYNYSYGQRLCQVGGFRTVMSYSCTGGSRVSYFSNPNVTLSTGISTGTASANNALSMNNTKAIVAAFRPSVVTVPQAPSNLMPAAISDSQINLTWTDNATNESGYRLERSGDGVNWIEFATVPGNTTFYSDTGRDPSTMYYYRVRAYNSSGNSSYSNTGAVTTHAAVIPCTNSAPTITMTPSSQYSKTSAAVSFNVVLANQDSAGCSPSTFTVTNSDGGNLGSFSLNPSASISTTWFLTAPSTDGSYTKSVTASALGHADISTAATMIADGIAPSAPTNISISVLRRTLVKLTWNASTDAGSGLDHYEILRNGAKVASVTGNNFSDKPGRRGTYTYTIQAFDKVGNFVGSSRTVTF